jgi:hypothetical protein
MRGTEPATPELLKMVESKGRTIVFARPGSEELRFLDTLRVNADAGGEDNCHVIVREDVRKIEVLEEFLHGTQRRIGMIDSLDTAVPERHVKQSMVRHRRLLGITEADAAVLEAMIRED